MRNVVFKREITSKIDYDKQRDHQVHTLYNYLFGWYLFSNCNDIKNIITEHVKKRVDCKKKPVNPKYIIQFFGGIWAYASLMHDIGYILEGVLNPLDMHYQKQIIQEGVGHINCFFRDLFWREFGIKSNDEISIIMSWTKINYPSFDYESMVQCGNSIANLGELDKLRSEVYRDLENSEMDIIPNVIKLRHGLSSDAFDLWKDHYSSYGYDKMADRIDNVRLTYQYLMSKGLPGQGIRLLDHGVVGGLILLQFATYFYKNYALMGRARPRGGDKEKIWVYFKEERPKITKLTYDAYWWWYSILWGTAATAIHNIQQSFRFWPYNQEKIKPLSIEEDPLSYLGILVDLIQEWDRYTVDKRSILTGNLPFQGDDVNLSIKNGKIILNYKDKNKSNKVRLELDNSLADWDKIISVVRNK